MPQVYNSIIESIGGTPLVRLRNIPSGTASIYCKLENSNPGFSVKDRIALNMIRDAEKKGILKSGMTIIEPTSGNTGLGIALVAAASGYRAVIVMPDTMSQERQKMIRFLGARVILTPGEKGMRGSIEKAHQIQEEEGGILLSQFSNPANPEAHYRTTGPEIWDALEGKVDMLVSGIGTGGTITGTTRFLKEKNPGFLAYGVEPEKSAVLSGDPPGRHKIQGIGAGFIPDNLDRKLVHEVIRITDEEAINAARMLAQKEGILGGISSGANLAAALKIAQRDDAAHKTIVTFVCDTAERYASTYLFED